MEKIISEVLSGKKGAATRFYQEYAPSIRRYIRGKVGNEAVVEELLQDTFLSAFDAMPIFRGEASIKTWLIAIARHEVLDFYRKQYVRKMVEKTSILWDGVGESLTTPEGELARHEMSERFDKSMGRLTNKYKEVLELRYLKGLSVKEIAAKLEMSFKATESLLFRARVAFVEEYGER